MKTTQKNAVIATIAGITTGLITFIGMEAAWWFSLLLGLGVIGGFFNKLNEQSANQKAADSSD